MVKAVVFDLDDTLYDYKRANVIGMEALCGYAAQKLAVDRQAFIDAYQFGREKTKDLLPPCAAVHSRILYCQHALEYLHINPLVHALTMQSIFWNDFLAVIEPFAGVETMLQHLHARDIKIGICTDLTAEIQYRKIQKLGLGQYIDAIVTSEEVGIEKPDRKMFALALEKLSTDFADALMVGDDFHKDIEGAMKAGLQAAWYTKKSIKGIPCFASYEDGSVERLCGI